MNDRNQKMLEEFLQDLLFRAESKEELNLIVEILLEMQGTRTLEEKDKTRESNPWDERPSRCHLYKMCPDGIQWVGFVKGVEKTGDMLHGLNSAEGGFYFLYDERSGKVVEFLDARPNTQTSGFLN